MEDSKSAPRLMRRKRRFRWLALFVVVGAGASAIAYASVPHMFATNETLTADNLNGNFNALDSRLSAVETTAGSAFGVLEMASDVNQAGAMGADLVYTAVSLTLTPGTWLVEAYASVAA